MPDLVQSLQGRDLGFLRIIAELWDIELDAPDARTALQRLAPALLDKALIHQGVNALPAEGREALDDLFQNEGRLPWQLFTRRYGAVREMGAGRRDRERPHLKPASPAEILWYRALVGRAFFDTPTGAQEFAYIPDDLLHLLPAPQDMVEVPLGRPATAAECSYPILANDTILDHACTLLSALRLGIAPESLPQFASFPVPLSPFHLKLLLSSAGLLDESGLPQPEPVRAFLEASRGEALLQLVTAWLNSAIFNDLRLVPRLVAEGDWENDPRRTRQSILDFLSTLPGGEASAEAIPAGEPSGREHYPFWNIDSFVAAIRAKHPDFQRPAGDYDSWFIRDQYTNEFLRGFVNWERVDGALVRFVLTGPLHWLGILDLAAPASDLPVVAFRFSEWASALLRGRAPTGMHAEDGPISIRSNGQLRLSRYAPRAVRYQLARFCAWEEEKEGVYVYRLTPSTLGRARQQGLSVNHLITLLARHVKAVPPSLVNALRRWDQHGSEARLEQVLVLRVSSPDMLQRLRGSRAGRFLGDPLGPVTIVVKPGAAQKVLDVLAEMGYLGDALSEDR